MNLPINDATVALAAALNTPAAAALLEKCSGFVEGLFRPHQMKRIAQAEVDSALIRAEGEIDLELLRRTGNRLVREETAKQKNMERIVTLAIGQLPSDSKPAEISDDWIFQFFDKCRTTSDASMQHLWARILAGESRQAGSFSRRAINILAQLDQNEIGALGRIRSACLEEANGDFVLFQPQDDDELFLKRIGVSAVAILQLKHTGLVDIDSPGGFFIACDSQRVTYGYGSSKIVVEADARIEHFRASSFAITAVGSQLARLSEFTPIPNFVEDVVDSLRLRFRVTLG